MSYKVVELVLDNGPADQTETLVLVAIAEYASDDGYAYPGVANVARRARCCERHTIRVIKKLAVDGWLVELPKSEGPGKKLTAYQLNMAKLSSRESHDIQIADGKLHREENKRRKEESDATQIAGDESHDISAHSHMTFSPLSHDISAIPILKNHEPSEPSGANALRGALDFGEDHGQASPSKPKAVKIPAANVFVLPDWISLEKWAAFVEMRKKKRAPMTDYARAKIIKDLDSLRKMGNDPNEVLDQSTVCAWTGVYKIRSAPASGPRFASLPAPKLKYLSESDIAQQAFMSVAERARIQRRTA